MVAQMLDLENYTFSDNEFLFTTLKIGNVIFTGAISFNVGFQPIANA